MPAALIWAFKAVKGHIKRQLFLIILEIYIRRLGNIPNKAKCWQTLSILKQYDGGPVPLCQFGRKCFYPQIAEGPLGRFVCLWEPLSGSENFPRMIGINLEQMVIIMVHSHTLAGTLGGNLAQCAGGLVSSHSGNLKPRNMESELTKLHFVYDFIWNEKCDKVENV